MVRFLLLPCRGLSVAAVTLDTYAHVLPTMDETLVTRMDDLLSRIGRKKGEIGA